MHATSAVNQLYTVQFPSERAHLGHAAATPRVRSRRFRVLDQVRDQVGDTSVYRIPVPSSLPLESVCPHCWEEDEESVEAAELETSDVRSLVDAHDDDDDDDDDTSEEDMQEVHRLEEVRESLDCIPRNGMENRLMFQEVVFEE